MGVAPIGAAPFLLGAGQAAGVGWRNRPQPR